MAAQPQETGRFPGIVGPSGLIHEDPVSKVEEDTCGLHMHMDSRVQVCMLTLMCTHLHTLLTEPGMMVRKHDRD